MKQSTRSSAHTNLTSHRRSASTATNFPTSLSPCSMVLYDKPIRKELGLVKTPKENKYCCLLDGYNCDKYKYLKND